MAQFTFHSEETSYTVKNRLKIKSWLRSVIAQEKKQCGDISIIHCSDEYLLRMNQTHLAHDYYTDIITFDYSNNEIVSGDLFISIERVTENALKNNVSVELENLRVMVHGILHLLGYQDKTVDKKRKMTALEDHYLSLYLAL
jgi:probable rRNA maturation factor